MADDKNKLANFKTAVLNDAEIDAEKIFSLAQKKAEQRKKQLKSEISNNEAVEILRIDKQSDEKIIRDISSYELEADRKVLLYRKNIVDKVFDEIENRLKFFRQEDKYEKYLLNSVKSCLDKFPNQKGIIGIGKFDEKYAEKLKELSGFEIETMLSIQLGGLTVSYPKINCMVDCTFDSALEEEKENFCNVSQLAF